MSVARGGASSHPPRSVVNGRADPPFSYAPLLSAHILSRLTAAPPRSCSHRTAVCVWRGRDIFAPSRKYRHRARTRRRIGAHGFRCRRQNLRPGAGRPLPGRLRNTESGSATRNICQWQRISGKTRLCEANSGHKKTVVGISGRAPPPPPAKWFPNCAHATPRNEGQPPCTRRLRNHRCTEPCARVEGNAACVARSIAEDRLLARMFN